MVMMFVFDAVVVAAAAGFGFRLDWGGLALLVVLLGLLMVTMSAFSVATALVTKDISSFAAIINGLNLPVLLLAGVLLPISFGPAWMRVLAHFNPLYYAVEGARALSRRRLRQPGRLAGVRRAGSAVRGGGHVGHPGVPPGGGLTGPRDPRDQPGPPATKASPPWGT